MRFEMTEPWVFLKSVAPVRTRRTTTRWAAIFGPQI